MAYCTPAQFLLRVDKRVVADYCSDDGTPIEYADLPTNEVLLAALDDASGRLQRAVRRGQKYTLAVLQALYEDESSADPQGRQFQIIPLVANLALGMLISRRALSEEDLYKLAPRYREAMKDLEDLESGMQIFDDINEVHAEAGVHVANINPSGSLWSACATRLLGAPGCCNTGYPAVGGYSYPPPGSGCGS